jgi:hypothetical protein
MGKAEAQAQQYKDTSPPPTEKEEKLRSWSHAISCILPCPLCPVSTQLGTILLLPSALGLPRFHGLFAFKLQHLLSLWLVRTLKGSGALARSACARCVVEAFDVFEDRGPCCPAARPRMTMDQLPFERGDEALSHRVVVVGVCYTVPIEGSRPPSLRRLPNSTEVYWLPLSEWWMSPGCGLRL